METSAYNHRSPPPSPKRWRTIIRAPLQRAAPPTDAALPEYSVCDRPSDYIAMKVSEDRGTSTGASSSTSNSSPSGSAKRSRDPEDEVYLDNLHSSKRYLSEIMASSLNGLTVGREENLSGSPARSDSMLYLRDEMSSQYSPMSEDSDDSRFCEAPFSGCSSQSESLPTSPVSPYRCQKPSFSTLSAPASNGPTASPSPSYNSNFMASSSQPRQRGSDSEGRFPSSPSDICHSADLRRAALLRSVQMRKQPCGHPAYELPFGSGQEAVPNVEGEDIKSIVEEKDYHEEECHSMGLPASEYPDEKYCNPLNSDSSSEDNGT